jgi:putative protease
MKILSPIDRASEVDLLADAGADEFYGGYVSGRWRGKYSMLGSANHRYFPSAQIASAKELKALVKAVHGRGKKFYLTMNAPFYSVEQYADLLEDARKYHGLGVDAFIISDLGLILRMRDKLPEANIHLSTLGTIFNSQSATFFHSVGVDRMVFPRELTLKEIKGITNANPDVFFDAFVLIGKCPNIEGFCGFTHNSPDLIWPCEEKYSATVLKGKVAAGAIIDAQSGWSRVNRRQACGLCAIGALEGAGVRALKIVGRGGPTVMKLKAVQAVREMIDMKAGGTASPTEAAHRLYMELFGNPCNPYVCYFPELHTT